MPILPTEYLQGGAAGLLAIVVLMICLGFLVPKSTCKQLERDRDYWREVAIKAIGHADQLLPAARITTEVTRALSDATSASVQQAISRGTTPSDETRPA
jgi:hypothetical protein